MLNILILGNGAREKVIAEKLKPNIILNSQSTNFNEILFMFESPILSVRQATLDLLTAEGFDQVPVVGDQGLVLGMATVGNMMAQVCRPCAGL